MAEVTKLNLPESIFDVPTANHELLKLAYNSYLANGRPNLAKTLRRGEVRGGGIKPWKQKGTGRARVGSSRSPIWRKGGITFGPLGIENYTLKMSVQSKRVALRQALTLAYKSDSIQVIKDLKTSGKTKDIVSMLRELGLPEKTKVLIAVDHKTESLIRATGNLENVTLTQASYLNVFNILNADKILVTDAGMKMIEQWLGGEK